MQFFCGLCSLTLTKYTTFDSILFLTNTLSYSYQIHYPSSPYCITATVCSVGLLYIPLRHLWKVFVGLFYHAFTRRKKLLTKYTKCSKIQNVNRTNKRQAQAVTKKCKGKPSKHNWPRQKVHQLWKALRNRQEFSHAKAPNTQQA